MIHKELREQLLLLRVGGIINAPITGKQADDICRRVRKGTNKWFGYKTLTAGVQIRRYE